MFFKHLRIFAEDSKVKGMKTKNHISCSVKALPFKTSLSFEFLIEEIRNIYESGNHPMQAMAKNVLETLKNAPEFNAPISNENLLKKHENLVRQLIAFVINPLNDSTQMAAVCAPFGHDIIHSTSLFDTTVQGESKTIEIAKDVDQDLSVIAMIYQAYLVILKEVYKFNFDNDLPFTFRLTDTKTGAIKYLRKEFSHKYLRVKTSKKAPKLTEKDIAELFDNSENLDLWLKKIPLEHFEFTGIVNFNLFNVTREFVISQLKTDLLDKNAVVSKAGFEKIRKRMRALFENPNLEFGMAVTPDKEASLNSNLVWNTIIPRSEVKCEQYRGTIYEKAFMENRIILSSDIAKLKKDTIVEAYLKKGIRSHAVVPLIIEDQPVGMLEFGSTEPNAITMLQIKRLFDVFPTFALALQRSKEEWNDKIRAIIQDEFTAIHPTVEWRFREAVAQLLNNSEEKSSVEPIVFPEVVPIYGASDIRGSSIERNKAIQSDLTEQLELAQHILEESKQIKEMPLLDDISFKISEHIKTVKTGLKAGDEVVIIDFLKYDIDPVLRLMQERYPQMETAVQSYFDKLDPDLHVLYKKRKDFENSLTLINDKVSEIIDSEQVKAQSVFPHYFEKYRTDGLEYNGYIGQSLVNNLKYSPIYLRNIRLWQLLVKVKVARKVAALQPELPTKLDITQLILVHSNPLSIAFRQDEKKFDVAGAYNIRYEITKKRIDKALVKGTNQRVTQVGKIAIIYSHAEEIREYQKYIDYLVARGFLNSNVEELELEDLKGASGLRALRVEVNLNSNQSEEIHFEKISELVE